MVYRPNIPAPRLRETTEHSNLVVHLERGHLPSAPIHSAKKERGGRLGLNKPTGKVSCTLHSPDPNTGTITAEWLKKWNLIKQNVNPPFRERIPAALDYPRSLAIESAYVALQGNTESQKAYKRRIYGTMRSILGAPGGEREMRIAGLWPKVN
jgi:hypothetical protein